MSRKQIPIMALVGSANVGKSSIFNLLINERRNIVAKEAGTTRDSIAQLIKISDDKPLWLVDTAGLKDPEDDFETSIQEQIASAIESADIIAVVIEAQALINQADRQIAKLALKKKKEVILIANKLDLNLKANPADFLSLGIKNIFLLSTTTKAGLNQLWQYLDTNLSIKSIDETEEKIKIALLGRPNVGKSTLFNALIKKQQAIISKRAGTTRDINRQTIRFEKQSLEFLDTAGIKRSGKTEVGVEKFSLLRTLGAIEECQVCLLVIDVSQLATAVEQKIAGLVKEANKGLVIAINKWDTLAEQEFNDPEQIKAKMRQSFDFVPWASLIFVSAVQGRNLNKIFELVKEIETRRCQNIQTATLNSWLQKAIAHHPPAGIKGRQPKIKYVVQTKPPAPIFSFFGSNTNYLHFSYPRYLEKNLRENFDYQGTAIHLIFKEKS